MEPETAGDPCSEQKWVRSSLRQLSGRLAAAGSAASAPTVARLLRSLDYALHVNAKQREARAGHPDRDQQFRSIERQRQAFERAGLAATTARARRLAQEETDMPTDTTTKDAISACQT